MHTYTYFVSFVSPDQSFGNATVQLDEKIKSNEMIEAIQTMVNGRLLYFVQIDYKKGKKADGDTQTG